MREIVYNPSNPGDIGIERFTLENPVEIAIRATKTFNDYCTAKNIKNSHGDIVQLDANDASELWLMMFAYGYEYNFLQRELFYGMNGFNIGNADERQLLNLAEIKGKSLYQKSPSTVIVTITCLWTDPNTPMPVPPAPIPFIEMPNRQEMTIQDIKGKTKTFISAMSYRISVGTTRQAIFVAKDELGPILFPNGSAINLVIPSSAIPAKTTYTATFFQSLPGRNLETIDSLRQRMQIKRNASSDKDEAMEAIMSLAGVTYCKIYFNEDNLNPLQIAPNYNIAPRWAMIFVQGYSDKIAEAYYGSMNARTSPVGFYTSQRYETKAGQVFYCHFMSPIGINIYVNVYIRGRATDDILVEIRNLVTGLSGSKNIGEQILASDVYEVLRNASVEIQGVKISDDGNTFDFMSNINAIQVANIPIENIDVIGTYV